VEVRRDCKVGDVVSLTEVTIFLLQSRLPEYQPFRFLIDLALTLCDSHPPSFRSIATNLADSPPAYAIIAAAPCRTAPLHSHFFECRAVLFRLSIKGKRCPAVSTLLARVRVSQVPFLCIMILASPHLLEGSIELPPPPTSLLIASDYCLFCSRNLHHKDAELHSASCGRPVNSP
jgi:hypothetical protein